MLRKKFLIVATCSAIAGLVAASCAPAAAPTSTPKPAATTPAKTPAVAPTEPGKPVAPTAKPAAPTPTPKPAAEQPTYGGVLTTGTGGDPPSLDVHQGESSFMYSITAATYSGLLRPDPRGWPEFKPVADLATSWQISPDGKVYTFSLARGAKFHDGALVTAEDVKFSLDRIRNPQRGMRSPRREQLANVASIDTPDDYTVKITLGNPQASFVTFMATVYFAVMPKHVVLEKKNDMTNTVVGSGPFKFKDYASGVSWEVVKNPDYFVKGQPYLDGVKGYIIKDGFTRFAALRTKKILWWAPFPMMSVSQAKIIAETLSDKIAVEWAFHPAWYGAIFNVTRPPWSDVRVRQAVSLTFDRKRMLAVGLEGAGVVGMAAQPPGEWTLPDEEMTRAPGYAKPDLEAARRLMSEAGFSNGLKAEALVRGVKPHQDVAVLLKDAVAAIGITLDLKVVETAAFNDARFRKAFAIIGGGAGLPLMDPDNQLGEFYVTDAGKNWTGYSNPNYDELYARQSRTVDVTERRKIVWEMQRILLKDVPIALAYWTNVPYAWWRDVRGYTPPVSFDNAFGYQEIWLAR
ncbi:MAG: ABC transporter substrate-binding protein [Chloroflexi bacterium]|nr:ABC transporter substrate-binding protein [Chloroflexota bacterium]